MLQCPPIPLCLYPYAPCLYAPSVEHKLTGPLASGVQSGAPVGRIMLSPPSNYHLDTLLHSFLSVFVAKADQLMRQKIRNSSPRSFNNGSSSYYLWPPWDLFLPQLVDSFRSKFGFLLSPSCGPGSWCWDCAARSSGNLYLREIHFFGTYQSWTTVFRDIPNLAKKDAFNLALLTLSRCFL